MSNKELAALIQSLNDALAAQDWEAIAEIDNNMRPLVESAVDFIRANTGDDSGSVNAVEQQLTALSALYRRAQALVGDQKNAVQHKLSTLAVGKVGVAEYARHSVPSVDMD